MALRSCADIAITRDDGSADDTPPAPSEPPAPDEDDYNEVDTDRQHDHLDVGEKPQDETNYVGHVVALTLACVLLPLTLLVAALYFFCVRDRVRSLVSRHSRFWSDDKSSSSGAAVIHNEGKLATRGNQLDFPNPPFGVPPTAPPRRHRRNSSSGSLPPNSGDTASTFPNPV